jgi:hypothetical protein
MRAVTVFLVAVLAGLPVRSLAADPPIAERPVYNSGDIFEYVDRFETIACKRWEVSGYYPDGSFSSQCDGNVAYFAAGSGALLRIVRKDGKELVKFRPSAPAIPFPLQIGTRWQGKFEVSTAHDVLSPSLDESCEVKSFETVDVAAGNLAAFRYECVTTWSVLLLHGTVTETGWYAPAAKAVVKVINSSAPEWNLELASYSPK